MSEAQSTIYVVVLFATVMLCAMEYSRWNFHGVAFYLLGTMAMCVVSFPAEVEAKLRCLPLFKTNTPKLTNTDSPIKIISQMNLEIENEDVQEDGLNALIILTDPIKSSEETRKLIFQYGISPLIMRFIKDHEVSSQLKILALKLLKNLSTLNEMKDLFEGEGDVCEISSLVSLMVDELALNKQMLVEAAELQVSQEEREQTVAEASKYTAEIQRLIAMVLGSLCDKRNDLKTSIFDQGFVQAAIDALGYFKYHQDLTHWVLWAFFNLSFGHNSNKVELVRRNALAAVVEAMVQHKSSFIIQRQAVGLLFNCLMQAQDSKLDVGKMREVAYIQGMVPAIEEALRVHPDDAQLKAMGEGILADSKARAKQSLNQSQIKPDEVETIHN